jgi:hypothetical protein
VRRCVELGAPRGVPEESGEDLECREARWLGGDLEEVPVGGDAKVGVGVVEAEDGVEVDHTAGLHLGDLPERHPRLVAAQLLAEGGEGAPPQLTGGHVPHRLVVVVIAVQAQRPTECGIPIVMSRRASQLHAVRAGLRLAAGSARPGAAVERAGGVHQPE